MDFFRPKANIVRPYRVHLLGTMKAYFIFCTNPTSRCFTGHVIINQSLKLFYLSI